MRARALLIALLAALVVVEAVACATDDAATRPAPVADEGPAVVDEGAPAGVFYEVKAGDTLFEIARRHDVSVEELVEVNGLERADLLAVGQVVFIPDDGLALPSPPPAPAPPPPAAATSTTGALAWPLDDGVILRDFDPGRAVDGIIIAAPRGTAVRAAAAGEVVFVGDEGTTYGRMIILKHDEELLTIYAHLDETLVSRGQRVAAAAPLGTVGETGRAESPQLHFQVRRGRVPVDPLAHLPSP